jgi:hypothetical protein
MDSVNQLLWSGEDQTHGVLPMVTSVIAKLFAPDMSAFHQVAQITLRKSIDFH